MQIITLTTDFGGTDPFFGVMKGVILNIYKNVNIEDITHDVSPQNIWQANFILQASYHYFPKGTIHVCVVDPGVGTKRRSLLIVSDNYYFIGPDNGIFTGILEKEKIKQTIELTEKKYWLKAVSQTFHGRDVFAPVSAYLAKGIKPNKFGKTISKNSLIKLPIKKPIWKSNCVFGNIQFIDHFGNIITNIRNNTLPKNINGEICNTRFTGLVKSFSQASNGKVTAIEGSSGFIELFVNKSNAAKKLGSKIGNPVKIHFKT